MKVLIVAQDVIDYTAIRHAIGDIIEENHFSLKYDSREDVSVAGAKGQFVRSDLKVYLISDSIDDKESQYLDSIKLNLTSRLGFTGEQVSCPLKISQLLKKE